MRTRDDASDKHGLISPLTCDPDELPFQHTSGHTTKPQFAIIATRILPMREHPAHQRRLK
jgi:hypothetical protein